MQEVQDVIEQLRVRLVGTLARLEEGEVEAADGAVDAVAIREALARIADGSYGRCRRCGEEIGLPRLRALPHVSTCLGCSR